MVTPVFSDIPTRASFRSPEVCKIADIKPYVLLAWENEFPSLGVTKDSGSRVYRRADLELVLRLKQMVYVEGLTLGGARRRLEGELAAVEESKESLDVTVEVAATVRKSLDEAKVGLRGILEMLSANGGGAVQHAGVTRRKSDGSKVKRARASGGHNGTGKTKLGRSGQGRKRASGGPRKRKASKRVKR